MQIDQRGGVKGTMGCVDNLLIDKTILDDASKNKKNISCVWIDVKKAFDSVSHNWLITALEDHGINKRLITLIKNIIQTWKITLSAPTCNGRESIGPISIQRGILQGDSFCVKLFTLCLNPIAWYLHTTEGYTLTHEKKVKITHCLFVDDLKSYHKNAVKAATITNKLQKMFKDIGLTWGINKCAAVHLKRGKLEKRDDLPLSDNENIPVLGDEDYYKYLGKFENTTQLEKQVQKSASKEYIRRVSLIWSSPLSIPRKVKATQTFALPVLQHHMWTTDWPIDKLKEIDRQTRKVINNNNCKHRQESLPLLYLPPSKGGRGLTEIETLYKSTKIKLAHYITCSTDPHVQLVRTYQDAKEEKSLRSIIKDARAFATQINLDISYDTENKKTILTYNSTVLEVNNCKPSSMKSIIKKEVVKKYEFEVKQQPWVGQFTVKQWNNENLHKEWCDLTKVWKSIPTVVHSVHTSITQQLLQTKVYKVKKLKGEEEDLKCRFCHSQDENVAHIMCKCSALAQSLYTARHDCMLRPVYHAILKKFDLSEDDVKDTSWHKEPKPKSCVENENAKVLWNIPIYLDKVPKDGANKPDIVVQDKKDNRFFIFEGTVCNVGEINDRDQRKTEKYTDLRSSLKRMNPGYKIIQVNIVFDFLSGYHTNLISKLTEAGLSEELNIVRKCQKWIISQNCEIVKRLYDC